MVFFRKEALERFERRRRGKADLDGEAECEVREVFGGLLVFVGAAVVEVHAVGAGGVEARAVELRDEIDEALIDGGRRDAFVASAPDGDGRMVAEAEMVSRALRRKSAESSGSRL